MDPTRFGDNPEGRLVRAGLGDAAYWAFVPNPLPPEWQPDLSAIARLSAADRALGELAGLGRALPNPHLLVGPFIRREAVASSHIEGTQAGIAELYAYEAGRGPKGKAAADVMEVANYVKAMEYGLKRLQDLPISLRLLREVHGVLMAGVRGDHATPGEFRTSQNWIGRPGSSLAEADFVPPPVPEMTEALGKLEQYLHITNGFPPLVRLAFIHQHFEAIHPFLDGNGRLGRLLVTFLMVSWDLLPLPLLYLSPFFERRRDEYYDLLSAVNERGTWRNWVVFFLEGVEEQARDAVIRAKRLQDLQLAWRDQLLKARESAVVIALADLLFQKPVVSITDAARELGVTFHSARRGMERLARYGIVEQTDEVSYGKSFSSQQVLEISGRGNRGE